MLANATTEGHAVQFYQGEPFLHRAIARFFRPAIRAGEPIAMVVRRRTFGGVADCLSSSHDSVLEAAVERLVFVDADEALPTFMDGLTPDPERFGRCFADLVTAARRRSERGSLWVYGEMVDVLCKAGNHPAALRVEELWNVVSAGHPMSVTCAYSIDDFDHDLHATAFQAICRQHTH